MKLKRFSGTVLFFSGLLLLWQLFYTVFCDWLGFAKPYAVPSPSGVFDCTMLLLRNGVLLSSIARSMLRVLTGFGISVLLGILLGIPLVHSRYLAQNLKPLILGVQTLPSICWVPFAVLWFGLTESAIIFVVIMGSAFGIAIAIENCVKNVPPVYIRAAKTMGVNTFQLYHDVIFPAALPSFIAGLKQGWSFAWRVRRSHVRIHRTWLYADGRARPGRHKSGNDHYAGNCFDWRFGGQGTFFGFGISNFKEERAFLIPSSVILQPEPLPYAVEFLICCYNPILSFLPDGCHPRTEQTC